MSKAKRRADGRLQSQIYIGTKDGKPQYKYVYAKTQSELDEKVLSVKLSLKKGIDIAAEYETFGDWVQEWLKLKTLEVCHGKMVAYKARVKNLYPIYDYPITKVKTADIQNIIITLATTPSERTKKPYAKETIKEVKNVARAVFQLAIENRILDYNPANAVKLPKDSPKETKRALTKEEMSWITNTPHRAQIAAMIMLFSGLRRGELIPLQWNDINLESGTISVNKSVEFIDCKPQIKESAKTTSGLRTVYIPKILVEFLKKQERSGDLVCPSAKGVLMTSTAWRQLWNSYLIDLNLKYGDFEGNTALQGKAPTSKYSPKKVPFVIPRFTAHWLRHTFITLMYHSGVDILTAKEQAGHSDIKTTMEIYTHLDKEFKKTSMSKIDDYLSGDTS